MIEKCVIIGAGEIRGEEKQDVLDCLQDKVLFIAADGGMRYCRLFGIKPDVCLGDFDSADEEDTEFFAGSLSVRLPREKDDTDMMAAIKYGMEKGCSEFLIFGGYGGRLDHTVANLQCLLYLRRRGCHGTMRFFGGEAFVLKNESIYFPAKSRGILSLFAVGGPAREVTLEGLKYPLTRATVSEDFPIGISNEFTGRESRITVEGGELLIVQYYT